MEQLRREEREALEQLGRQLVTAIKRADRETAREILDMPKSSVDITMIDESGMKALHHAARLRNLEAVEELLAREPAMANMITHFGRCMNASCRPLNVTRMRLSPGRRFPA